MIGGYAQIMKKIIIAGFGGQGVLSLGLMLSYSAMNMDYNTSWLPSYGPEMRGGTANVGVTYSRGDIACPIVSKPDVLVAFNKPSLDKFVNSVASGGTVVVNSSNADKEVERKDINVIRVPVSELASGINPRGGNIIMLGVLLPILKSLSLSAAEDAVKSVFKSKPNLIEPNIACLKAGMRFAEGEASCL